MVFNFILGLVTVPLMVIVGWFSDITGSSAALGHQMLYILPGLSIIGLAASVSLRRNGFGKSGFFA